MTSLNGPTSFANDGRDVLEQYIELNEDVVAQIPREKNEVLEMFEIDETVKMINEGGYERITLQFPDELLIISSIISDALKEKTNKNIYILADTSYGSCCVDEVAAEHVNADLIIHYGHSCLSRNSRIPVKYVFGQFPINTKYCIDCFNDKFGNDKSQPIILMFDVIYQHKIEEILKQLRETEQYTNIITSEINYKDIDSDKENSKIEQLDKITLEKKIEDYALFYIGGQSGALTNILITYSRCHCIISYDPCTKRCRDETYKAGGAMMKRYVMVQKVKDANIIGIVVGTLGIDSYTTIIEKLKQLIKACGKKYYFFVMGKLNVAKMANFMEIDAYVYVTCPENTFIDSKEYYKPIVTPYELILGLSEELEWTGEYITKFNELLPCLNTIIEKEKENQRQRQEKLKNISQADDDDYEDEAPHYSMLTGTLQPNRPYEDYATSAVSGGEATGLEADEMPHLVKELTQLNTTKEIAHYIGSAAGEFLSQRSFQGLEQKIGETEVQDIQPGRKGVARGYTHEKEME